MEGVYFPVRFSTYSLTSMLKNYKYLQFSVRVRTCEKRVIGKQPLGCVSWAFSNFYEYAWRQIT